MMSQTGNIILLGRSHRHHRRRSQRGLVAADLGRRCGLAALPRAVSSRQSAFTLLELLIVIALVSLLLALLLPALARARMGAQSAQCQNNLHQIMIGDSVYAADHKDQLPIAQPKRGVQSNYNFGGRYPIGSSPMSNYAARPWERPLNAYVHPNLPLGRDASLQELSDPDQYNFPAFECPADQFYNYQENWGSGRIAEDRSCYYAIGTSYVFNIAWIDWGPYRDVARGLTWDEGVRNFVRARSQYPSQFIAYHDDPADFHIGKRRVPPRSHHGADGKHAVAYLDGRASIIAIDTDRPFHPRQTFLFPETALR